MKGLLFLAPMTGLLMTGIAAVIESRNTEVVSDAPFSFENWAIAIANGEPHLSIDEAIKAYQDRQLDATAEHSIEKRWRCNHLAMPSANVPDAVTCINRLASNGQMCGTNAVSAFCTHGYAQIVGVKGGVDGYVQSSCQDVARAAGIVMDKCWRADNTVQGDEYAWGNGHLAVHVTSPSL